METNSLTSVLTGLSEKLAAFDQRAGLYCGHASTTKGITLKMPAGSLFLYHSFINKLVYHPDEVTNEELRDLVLNVQ